MSEYFSKGDIIYFKFEPSYLPAQHPQYTIIGPHYAVVLFDGGPERKIITLAPISSLNDNNGDKKSLRNWDMELNDYEKYGLSNESYIIMDQIHTVDRDGIVLQKTKIPLDTKTDIPKLNICLVIVMELFEAVNKLASEKMKITSEAVLEQLDEKILKSVKDKVSKEILSVMPDILSEYVKPMEIEDEIKDKLAEEFKKENLDVNDILSNKIVKIIREVIQSLFKRK